jgi:hypothetical protein
MPGTEWIERIEWWKEAPMRLIVARPIKSLFFDGLGCTSIKTGNPHFFKRGVRSSLEYTGITQSKEKGVSDISLTP